jgi:hypothetical protein
VNNSGRPITINNFLARVSTSGQSIEAQVRQLRAAGAGKMFREVASSAKTERAQLPRPLWRATAIGRAFYVNLQPRPPG